jgi:hypothetical protein
MRNGHIDRRSESADAGLAADAHRYRLAQANKLIRLFESGQPLPDGEIVPDLVDIEAVASSS